MPRAATTEMIRKQLANNVLQIQALENMHSAIDLLRSTESNSTNPSDVYLDTLLEESDRLERNIREMKEDSQFLRDSLRKE